jgi:DNA-directed RNA polymerase subunit RPC12/RpoP
MRPRASGWGLSAAPGGCYNRRQPETMSRLVSRILLSIFMFPLAAAFYLVVFVVTEQMLRGAMYSYQYRESTVFLASGVLTWPAVALYWYLLWRSGVQWNLSRVLGTFLAALGAAIVGGLAGVFATSLTEGSFGAFLGGFLAIILWLVGTVFIWRETAAERAERVKGSGKSGVTCPTCGYNLTGLSESRCPECGSKFTLDELMALQVGVDKEVE